MLYEVSNFINLHKTHALLVLLLIAVHLNGCTVYYPPIEPVDQETLQENLNLGNRVKIHTTAGKIQRITLISLGETYLMGKGSKGTVKISYQQIEKIEKADIKEVANAYSRGQQSFTHPEFNQLTNKSPQVLAILPVEAVNIVATKEKKANQSGRREQQEESLLQHEIYDIFSNYARKAHVVLQTVLKTNGLLRKESVDMDKLSDYAVQDLAKWLGADALIFVAIVTNRQVPKGVATAVDFFWDHSYAPSAGGISGEGTFSIYHGETGDHLWSYQESIRLGPGMTNLDVVDRLTRNAAQKCPYFM